MSRGTRTIEIFRYDPDRDAAPRMQTYTIELLDSDRMLLDVLVRLKKNGRNFDIPPFMPRGHLWFGRYEHQRQKWFVMLDQHEHLA